MKIALLTYFGADNYGAVLQSYATIKALKVRGHDVDLVNFIIPKPSRSWLKNLLLYPKHLKFERFRKKYFLHITAKYSTLSELQASPPIADCYLVGSDQTWNPDLSKDKAKGFFLDFGDKSVIRVSYASSFGVSEWKDSKWISKNEAEILLKRFDLISVREDSGIRILNNCFNIPNAQLVADPVMLFENYNELTGVIKPKDEIVLYKFVYSDKFYMIAKKIGEELNLPVRSLGSIRHIKGVKCNYPENVDEWIRNIAGASYVMTDSFHGSVLSLLYKKQFVVFPGNPKRETRLKSLLSYLNLSERYVIVDHPVGDVVRLLKTPIDYVEVHRKIAELRNKSNSFLDSLSNRVERKKTER